VICILLSRKTANNVKGFATAVAMLSRARLGQRRKIPHDLLVDAALEGHDQADQLIEVRPAPGLEFDLVPRRTCDGDFVFGADEAQCEPLLLLAAVAPAPGLQR
jgi:hypothetical protein